MRRSAGVVAAMAIWSASACGSGGDAPEPMGQVGQRVTVVPVVSPEIETDAPVLVPSTEMQVNAAVASDGSGYLVVWNDARPGSGITGARVDATGAVIEKTGFVIYSGGWLLAPKVSFDGADYVVFWGNSSQGARVARVSPAGNVLDNAPITVAPNGEAEAIAGGQNGSLAIWREYSGTTAKRYAQRVDQNGLVQGSPTELEVSKDEPAAAFNGVVYLVAWRVSNAIRAARLGANGQLVDSTPITIASTSTAYDRPAVARAGTDFIVTWGDKYPDKTRFARVTGGGAVLDPDGVVLPDITGVPDIGFDGASFLSVGKGSISNDIVGQRSAPSGALLDATPFAISSGPTSVEAPRVASRPGESLIVWAKGTGFPNTDIAGRRVASDGSLLGNAAIDFALGANEQTTPAVASDGTGFFLVWEDDRALDGGDVYAERMAQDGTVLDPVAIPVGVAAAGQEAPEATFDGQNYFTVWQDRRDGQLDVYGARVDPSGAVLDVGGFPIASSTETEAFPTVASNAAVSLVVWYQGSSANWDTYGARVAPNGDVLDPNGFLIAGGLGSQIGPVVASDGTDFLVVWRESPSKLPTLGTSQLRAARYAGDGTPLDPSPLELTSSDGSRGAQHVAFGGGLYLVVWTDGRNPSNWDIYGARVSPAGVLLDPDGIPLTQAPDDDVWPDVAWNGSTFVVAWGAPTERRGARVDLSGAVLDPGGFVIAPGENWGRPIRATANAAGTTLVSYARYDDAPEFRSTRARARTITFVESDAGAEDAGAADAGDAAVGDAGTDGGDAGVDASVDGSSLSPPSQRPLTVTGGGCGCSMPGSTPASYGWIALGLVLGGFVGRRAWFPAGPTKT